MKTHSILHWSTMMLAVVAVSYATLYFTKAEALYVRSVGTISVTKFVPNAESGKEFVILQFSGVLGKPSVANLVGWELRSDTGFSFDLSNINLSSSDSIRICEEASTDPNCDHYWPGNDVFSDTNGDLLLAARDGTAVIHIPYDSPSVGQSLSGSGDYLDDVYTSGDKIGICDYQNNSGLRTKNENIRKLTNDIEGDIAAANLIIPPFVYEDKKTLGYHPGVNWPNGKETLEAGCL